ncbi:MAG: hypothetical protein K8T10_06550 [Candidatus Eremiobacteraeota bacterium]|nr:hypothetical protein [Candidatus Eremiobacteraeota bacterium]
MCKSPENSKKFDKKSPARSKPNYMAEASRVDSTNYFKGFDFLSRIGESGFEFAERLSNLKERIEQFEEQRGFVLKVLPDLIHDIRSPLVSMVGFSEAFGNNSSEMDLTKEFSESVGEDGKIALKRLEGLEELIQSFLESRNHNLKDCSISKMVGWIIDVFDIKFQRKSLVLVKEFDEELLEKKFPLDSRNVKIILFEIFHNIIKCARNKDTMIVEGKKSGDNVILTFKLSPPRKPDEKETIKKLLPGCRVGKIKTRILSDPGYQLILSLDETEYS